MPFCPYCNAIAKVVQGPLSERQEETFVWKYGDVRRNKGCKTCQNIAKFFQACEYTSPTTKHKCYIKSVQSRSSCWSLFLKYPKRRQYDLYLDIQLIRIGEDSGNANAIGVAVGERSLNFSHVRKWMKNCDEHHLGICHTIADPWRTIQPATGIIFIDVERRCLTKQPVGSELCRYVSLSYIWGKTTNPIRTLLSNYKKFCRDGAFDNLIKSSRLPKTIEHCMTVTRALGLRYLWVDRFCLIQDDPNIAHHILAMASIYANSYVTIAATEGDHDDFGLPGVPSNVPRRQPFRQFDFGYGCQMIEDVPTDCVAAQVSYYHSRGWTFQEWGLSHRVLLFHDQTVSWMCHKHNEQENGIPMYPGIVPANIELGAIWTRSPDIVTYLHMVRWYTGRSLTNPNDILAAFSAIITVQGRAMLGGIFHGISELYFGIMLLWSPCETSPRRTNLDGAILKNFPSWSWTGWMGSISTDISRKICVGEPGLTYTHLVDFYKVLLAPGTRPRKPIRELHSYQSNPEEQKKLHDMSPEGQVIQNPTLLVDNSEAVALHTESSYSTAVECRTETARFQFDTDPSIKVIVVAPLIDVSGIVVGALDMRRPFVDEIIYGHEYFIRISELEVDRLYLDDLPVHFSYLWQCVHRYCPSDCRRSIDDCNIKQHWPMKLYNVLWIEWEDGIAYRKAAGIIYQNAWHAAGPKEVNIRLG